MTNKELVVTGTLIEGAVLEGSTKAWYCCTEEGEDIWAYGENIPEVLDYFTRCGWKTEWFTHIERDEAYDGPSNWPHDIWMRRYKPIRELVM